MKPTLIGAPAGRFDAGVAGAEPAGAELAEVGLDEECLVLDEHAVRASAIAAAPHIADKRLPLGVTTLDLLLLNGQPCAPGWRRK
jgi:hypothetical protein